MSHSSRNNRQAVALKHWLSEQRPELANEIFLDIDPTTGLQLGWEWKGQLLLRNSVCEWLVCLVSKNWIASTECLLEYHMADRTGKHLVVARLEDLSDADWRAAGHASGDITSKWQRCDLFAAGAQREMEVPAAPPAVPDGTPVRFNIAALHQIRRLIEGSGIGPDNFVWPPNDDKKRAPYRGWEPFDDSDAGVFFGRDAAIASGLGALRDMRFPSPGTSSAAESIFVVLGPSGSGKSSFLRAGLIPRLQREDGNFVVLGVMRAGHALTGEQGLAAAIDAACRVLGSPAVSLDDIEEACLRDDFDRICELLTQMRAAAATRLADTGSDGDGPTERAADSGQKRMAPTLVLPLDQAEELFPSKPGSEAVRFLKLIAQLLVKINATEVGLIVAATIRTDRYEKMQTDPSLRGIGAWLFNELKPMPPSEYKEVITGPARRASDSGAPLTIDDDLVQQLIADAQGPDTLPLLALTLDRLYRKYAKDRRFTLKRYRRLGGMRHVVNNVIEQKVLPSDPQQRKAALALLRSAFIPSLVDINPENNRPLRRVAPEADLPEEARPLIDALVDQRLLVRDRPGTPVDPAAPPLTSGTVSPKTPVAPMVTERDGQVVVEVALESLFEHWDELKGWLDEQGEDLKTVRDIERSAAGWETHRNPDWLLTGTRLADAEKLAATTQFAKRLAGASEFLAASRQAEDERTADEERSRQEQLRLARERQQAAEALAAAETEARQKAQEHAAALRKRSRILRIVLAVTLVIAAAAVGGFFWATQATRQADARTRDAMALRLVSEGEAMLAGGRAGGDVRALEELLAAGKLGSKVDPNTLLGGLLDGVIKRRDEQKIIENPACNPAPAIASTPCPVHSVAFSADGRRIVVGDDSHVLRQWDADTGTPIGEAMAGHANTVESVAVSSDGRYIASGSGDNTVRLWDAATGKQMDRAPMRHDQVVRSVAFNPFGDRIVSGGDDKTVRLWDTATGKQVDVAPMSHDGVVRSVAFNPLGDLIVSSDDSKLRVWEAKRGRLIAEAKVESAVLSVAFSPSGNQIVSGNLDGTVQVWDAPAVRTGDVPATMPLAGGEMTGHRSAVQSVAFSPDGSRIVSGGVDGTVRVWDAETRQPVGEPLTGHHGPVWGVAFSRDGRRIVSGSLDGTVREWDAIAGLPIPAGQRRIHAVALSPNGQQIASGGYDGTVKLWNAETGKQIGQPLGKPWDGDEHAVLTVAFSPDGSQIVWGDRDGIVRVSDVVTRQTFELLMVGPQATGNQRWIQSVAFNNNGTRIASGGDDGDVRLWNAKTREPIGVMTDDHHQVWSVAFSPDGHHIASANNDTNEGSTDYTINIWDADSPHTPPMGKLTGHTGQVYSVAFPDIYHVVSGSYDRSVRLWDIKANRQVARLTGHENSVLSVGFGHDGQWIVSAGSDGTVRLWDVATQKPIGTPMEAHAHGNWVFSVAYSSDSQRIVSGDWEGNLRLWPTPTDLPKALCSKLTSNMSHQQWRDWISANIDYIQLCPGLPIPAD
jgi:WD40 repeat protein